MHFGNDVSGDDGELEKSRFHVCYVLYVVLDELARGMSLLCERLCSQKIEPQLLLHSGDGLVERLLGVVELVELWLDPERVYSRCQDGARGGAVKEIAKAALGSWRAAEPPKNNLIVLMIRRCCDANRALHDWNEHLRSSGARQHCDFVQNLLLEGLPTLA